MDIHLLVGVASHPYCIARLVLARNDSFACLAGLREFVENEEFGESGAVDNTVVPEWRETLPMVTVEVREKVDERFWRK